MQQSEDGSEPEVAPAIANPSKLHGYITFFGGSFLQFTIGGLLYTLGNLVPYFASYGVYAQIHYGSIENYTYLDLQRIYSGQVIITNWIYFAFVFSTAIGMYAGGYCEIKYGIKIAIMCASFCMSFGFASTSLALTYGLLSKTFVYYMYCVYYLRRCACCEFMYINHGRIWWLRSWNGLSFTGDCWNAMVFR